MTKLFPVVLLILHQAELRQLYHELLVKEEWEVLVASDVASGFVELLNHPVDLVILDGAWQPAESIKMLEVLAVRTKWRGIPVILANYEGSIDALERQTRRMLALKLIDTQSLTPNELVSLMNELYKRRKLKENLKLK